MGPKIQCMIIEKVVSKLASYPLFVALVKSTKKLESDPFLLDGVEERSCADTIIQTVLHILTANHRSLVRQLPIT